MRLSRLSSCIFALFLALTIAPVKMQCQVAGGSISGTISDSSGAVVPKATVEIKNIETAVSRTLNTNDSGFYSAPNLRPGRYEVTVSAQGFASAKQTSVAVDIGAQIAINISLKVGSEATTVSVAGESSGIETSTSTLSGVVNGTTVRELPLNARDWTSLATLEPGVANIRTAPALAISNNRPIRGLGSQLTIGGNRPQQNNYRVDGISINDYSNGAPGSALGLDLGVDAIQEFSVITSNAPAAYGKSSGGIINAVTRSGTNSLHGTAYEFLRNSALDTRNFFDGATVPPFKRNQFGGSVGAPIKKDSTFIFADYEGLRQSLSSTQILIVPSPNARNGIITNPNGTTTTVVVDPKVKPFLGFFPSPNGGINGNSGTFTFTSAQISNENYFTTRVDHKLSTSDSLFGTYMIDKGDSTAPDSFNNVLVGALSKRQIISIEETHTFTQNLINSARFGYSRVAVQAPIALSAINPQAADPAFGFVPGKNVGGFNVSGFSNYPGGFGGVGEYQFYYNSFQWYDDAFWTKGKHAIKFGTGIERLQINQQGLANPAGVFVFGSLTNFLTNKATSFNSAFPDAITPRRLRQTILGLYVSDDYAFRPNLTLNLGLRYEMSSVPTEVDGKLTNLRNVTDPQPALGSPYFANPTLKNFEPRVGLAWDPYGDGKTSVRAGFGLYDVLPLTYQFELLTILSAPFYRQANLGTVPTGAFPTTAFSLLGTSGLRYASIDPNPSRSYVMQWNLNVERDLGKDVNLFVGYIGSRGNHLPFRADDVNVVQPIANTPAGYIWPTPKGSGKNLNPVLGPISELLWNEPSFYHALQTKVSRRFAKGLQFGAAYTWAKSIDTGSSTLVGNPFATTISSLPAFDPALRRSLADFDVRHVLSINYVWLVPGLQSGFAPVQWFASGWQLGGIYQASSGLPFSPTISGDPLGLNGFQATFAFPDRIAGPGCDTAVNPHSVNYINTACFAFPNPGTRLGNAKRNTLIGPGLSTFDLSLFKNNRITRISETFDIQFRMELFNVFNHTNFATPASSQIFNQTGGSLAPSAGGNGGVITATSTPSRQAQFAVKFIW